MQRLPVNSSEISILGYDAKAKLLEVTFRRGGVYHYFDVPQETYESFLKADSLGTYFSETIDKKYEYKKIS